MEIDFYRSGYTTILSCGTTNVGHYAYAQQGISDAGNESKAIFEAAALYAPASPDETWKLYAIELNDYKTWHNKEFYKIDAKYKFRKDRKEYCEIISLTPENVKQIYAVFLKASHNLTYATE